MPEISRTRKSQRRFQKLLTVQHLQSSLNRRDARFSSCQPVSLVLSMRTVHGRLSPSLPT
nr:MAG TPA: hypothetical protein [Caudoviricetes sp.]